MKWLTKYRDDKSVWYLFFYVNINKDENKEWWSEGSGRERGPGWF